MSFRSGNPAGASAWRESLLFRPPVSIDEAGSGRLREQAEKPAELQEG
jgi:hypothetical protein